jgi:hypothetical protein
MNAESALSLNAVQSNITVLHDMDTLLEIFLQSKRRTMDLGKTNVINHAHPNYVENVFSKDEDACRDFHDSLVARSWSSNVLWTGTRRSFVW